jgi:alanyl-tRNA synthetase
LIAQLFFLFLLRLLLEHLRLVQPGAKVTSVVDLERRARIEAHHTATHLLNAALRSVLGPHISQSGSLVDENRLRFDFTHPSPLTEAQLSQIEALVQRAAVEDVPLEAREMELEAALKEGALATFGEKYGQTVRSIKVGQCANFLPLLSSPLSLLPLFLTFALTSV